MQVTLFALAVVLVAASLAVAAEPGVAVQRPWQPRLPADLAVRPDHPRLLLSPTRLEELKRLVSEDPVARQLHGQVMAAAAARLDDPLPVHEKPDGRRLLEVSRRVLEDVRHLAYAWHMTGDERYRTRLWRVVEAAAEFPDWNPAHFLDTAEMGLALALAYDWLHDDWTPQQRAVLLDALDRHLLRHAEAAYSATGADRGKWWWVHGRSNWNLVCNGGIVAAAICLHDRDPRRAERIIRDSFASVQEGIRAFGPDGGYPEGPMYWGYAVKYLVNYLGSITTALGDDHGLADWPGLPGTTAYPLHMTGPTGDLFAINDAHTGRLKGVAEHLWLARRYEVPAAAAYRLQEARRDARPQDLIYYDPALLAKARDGVRLPTTVILKDVGLFLHRTAWGDPRATYVGVTAGKDRHGHTQLDAGSFVFETAGVRFIDDLGVDKATYVTHNYEKVPRFAFYRLRAEGHNTLVLDPGRDGEAGGDQHTEAPATVLEADTDGPAVGVVLDMAGRYPGKVEAYTRRFATAGDVLEVTDTLTATAEMPGWWFAHTRARVLLSEDGRTATLATDKARCRVELVGPPGVRFEVMSARPLPTSPDPHWQERNDGWRKLAVRFAAPAGRQVQITVRFTAGR